LHSLISYRQSEPINQYIISDAVKKLFARQRHLPRHGCQETRRVKTFQIRLRQAETQDII